MAIATTASLVLLAACAITIGFDVWLLLHLKRLHQMTRRRLFWVQLVALTVINLGYCFATLVYLLTLFGTTSSHKLSFQYCIFIFVLASACIETQIAIGFAAASYGDQRAAPVLHRGIPVSLCIMLLAVIVQGLMIELADRALIPREAWNTTLIFFWIVTFASYIASVCWTSGAPRVIRRRALARLSSYMANFLLTFGLAVWQEFVPQGPTFQVVASVLVRLNGAGNVCIYAFWMRRTAASEERVAVGAVGTALDEPRAVANDFERLAIDGHFDLLTSVAQSVSWRPQTAQLGQPPSFGSSSA